MKECADGTGEWLWGDGNRYTTSARNVGIPLGVNLFASLATRDWILYLNDDIVCCPGWDTAQIDALRLEPTDLVFLFSHLIEPVDVGNPVTIVQDFGRNSESLNKVALLKGYLEIPRRS